LHPVEAPVESVWIQQLKLKYDHLLFSSFAFNSNLRHYMEVFPRRSLRSTSFPPPAPAGAAPTLLPNIEAAAAVEAVEAEVEVAAALGLPRQSALASAWSESEYGTADSITLFRPPFRVSVILASADRPSCRLSVRHSSC
jgi:hypothetical protein